MTVATSDQEFFDWFTPRLPDATDRQRIDFIRQQFILTLAVIINNTPPSEHRTEAIRMLHKASQAAVFAYTHRPQESADARPEHADGAAGSDHGQAGGASAGS